ncbi:TPA: hypothetical protein ACPZNJ_002835 [Yersinia enterocolitica]|uniref:hypothetical protein n=1 Tax=Yersinia enterocolitica TaxID=630 RepID=UPI0028B80A15|nr:hypothetical protein [Yersinia enterocolitica]ELI8402845.1 hypothetical protein [Yersinia enterocolitica]HDL7179775.1 hypothetical protein [Yersinia enterocolitica]HEN3491021.1 hypothetical protein [Yersinia enterocolitica]
MKFKCTGKWNGEPFERITEAEDEADCYGHWHWWAAMGEATITDFVMEVCADEQPSAV